MVASTLGQILILVLWLVCGLLGLFLVLSLTFKLVTFLSLKFRPPLVQKGELVKKKFFVCRDGYQLNWFGEINPQGTKILLGLHDLGMSSQDFQSFRDFVFATNPNFSVVSYDQRNFGQNEIQEKRNAGSMILDLQDIVVNLKEKFPHQEIILVGEGLGFYLGVYVAARQPQVSKIVGIGLKNRQPYQKTWSMKMALLSGILFSSAKMIKVPGVGTDLSTNIDFSKQIDNNLFEKGQISVKEYFQHQQLKRTSIHSLSQLNQPVLILQGQKDIQTDFGQTKKMLDKTITSKFLINYFPEKKHFLLNEPNNEPILKALLEWAE